MQTNTDLLEKKVGEMVEDIKYGPWSSTTMLAAIIGDVQVQIIVTKDADDMMDGKDPGIFE